MLVFSIKAPTLAIDINEFGDFSSRSILMNKINGTADKMTQEQKDLLKSKKLIPTVECLIKQIKKDNYDNVSLLLEAKVNPNESYYTEYPVYIAAKENNFEIVKLLISYNAKLDKGFNSELFEAVKNKNNEMAMFLLDKRARVNYQDSVTSNSILYYAIKNNMTDVAIRLIDGGAKLDNKTRKLITKKKLLDIIENR